MLKGKKIGVIGTGKMGSVLISGVLSRNLISKDDFIVSDIAVDNLEYQKNKHGIHVTNDNKIVAKKSNIIILAVKPQIMAGVLDEIAGAVDQKKVVISVAAGISTMFIESRLKKGTRVVRTMPNTPALIGEGVTAICRGTNATDGDIDLTRYIFESVGSVVDVGEDLMDAVTGLSGSGPAYVFLIIEALTDAGVNMGLSRSVAQKLSIQTVLGAARLCLSENLHPAQLKDMVTSPGGTTIAGIKVLEEGKLRATLMSAVEAATIRARELGKK